MIIDQPIFVFSQIMLLIEHITIGLMSYVNKDSFDANNRRYT